MQTENAAVGNSGGVLVDRVNCQRGGMVSNVGKAGSR